MSPVKDKQETVVDDPQTAPSEAEELRALVARQQRQIDKLVAAANPADPNDSGPGYKYRLTLADGSVVDYQGAPPTHWAVDGSDDVLDVIIAARIP